MLRLYTGSDINVLADSLLSELSDHPSSNPLTPELFVVQNYGMARWLSHTIAEKRGIAANLQFKFPAEVFWKIIRLIKPNIPEDLPSERLPMTWAIFNILQTEFDSSLREIHQYVQHNDPQKQEMRGWQLACRIGDVFDQYLTYRPKMLGAWQRKQRKTKDPAERWQATLWQKLNTQWQNREWAHRADIQKQIFSSIGRGDFSQDRLPSRITMFGVSEIPPVYLKLFLKLAKYSDIHFYLTDFSANDDNSLVHSLGQAGREFKDSINHELGRGNGIKWSQNELKSSVNQHDKSLFRILKHNLLNGQETEQALVPDNTVQIHSCHSARREIEVLYDQLLDIFDRRQDINPSDVLVLSPQMEDYAPDVDAVFGAVEEGVTEIPFNISEKSHARLVDISFIKIMQLVDSRFKVTDVLDLLDISPIRKTFSFSEDDIHTLEMWIDDTRIRWGIDEQHKKSLSVPSSKSYTWQAGLHRMVLGYAMAGSNDALFEGIYPYDEIQHSGHSDLLGRFSQFMHHLYECHQQVEEAHTPQKWSTILNNWLELFYPVDDTLIRQVQQLQNVIVGLKDEAENANFKKPVSFQIIRNYIKDRLDQQQTGGGRRGQGVTFSSIIPMRNIPAKVIALIGLNDEAFPRTAKGVSFDLITKYPKSGDRTQAKVDRQLFLEALMAAEESLYISYTGQSNKKDVDFPPSVLVKELTNYIENQYGITFKELRQCHRLQSFSPKYFIDKNEYLFSYSKVNSDIASQLYTKAKGSYSFFSGGLREPDSAFKNISINDLISFFQHPSKFLFNKRLGIYLRDDSVMDEDREPFTLNSLEKYNLGQDLLRCFLNNKSLEAYKNIALSSNLLPVGWPGMQTFNRNAEEVKEFSNYIKELFNQNQLEPMEVHYKSNGFSITGRLDTIYEDAQLFYRFGKLRPKDRISLWINHLLFQTVKPEDHSGQSLFITRDRKKPVEICRLSGISEPEVILDTLMQNYWQGLQDYLLFFPKTSYAYAEMILEKEKSEEEAIVAAHKQWDDDWNDFNEFSDDYNKLYVGNYNILEDSVLAQKFKNISTSFWTPFFMSKNAAMEEST